MSRARQPRIPSKPDGDVWVRTYAVRFTAGLDAPAHAHQWHQLSYASAGVLRVATAEAAWIVPPNRAVWIPAGVEHREAMRGAGTMRSLYLASGICRALPRACVVMNVPPLLRELIMTAAESGALDAGKPADKHLAQVIVDRLALLQPAHAQQLPMPSDRRALAVAERLAKNPANDDDLAALGRRAGASKRTLQRLFLAQTRLSFARWRARMRLLAAVEHLGHGRSVTDAALAVGYQSVSAFVSAFRREFGVSPGKFAAG